MSRKGALLVHGLTGSPGNLEPIAKGLKERGFIVKSPLLAGHGKTLADLHRKTRKDWYDDVVRAYNELSKEVDEIYFVGLSMGGVLGLKLAANGGSPIKALAVLGAPLLLKPLFRSFVVPAVRYSPLRFIIRNNKKNIEKSVLSPQGRIDYRRTSYTHMPSESVFEFVDLADEVRKQLASVHQPLLLLHGKYDHISDPHWLTEIKEHAGSKTIKEVILPNSGHVLPFDNDKEQVVEEIIRFFESVPDSSVE